MCDTNRLTSDVDSVSVASARAGRSVALRRGWFVVGMFAFAALVLSGCLTILPQWQRTVEIQHSDVTELNDKNPIIAQSGQNRFILFIGDTQSGDKELFLQRMNAAGQLVGGATKLTNNTGEDDQPQLAEQDGWLYVVWRYKQTPSDPYAIWWARVNTTTLSYASGPTLVTTLPGDSYTPQLAVRSDGTSVVVWQQVDNNLGTIYYRQVNSNGTFGGAEVIVSQGPGCASASYDQRNPRVTRSYSGGGFAQVAWIGQNSGGDSVYWREMDNTSNAPSTDCIVLSDGVTYAGPEIDLDLAINPGTNRSYVAWTHQNQPGNDEDVYFRSVSFFFPGQPCDILNVSNAVTTTSEGGVRIAAGHAISNWVHLVWERYNQTAGQGSIRYALIQDGANCANAGQKTPTKITPSGNLSLSGLPVPPTADVDSPKIAVATNAVIARLSDGSSTMMMSAQGAQFDEAALLAQMSSEEASADSSDAAVTPAFNEGPAPATASLDTLHATEAQNETPPQPAPDCAATPDHPRCVEQARLSQMGGMMGYAPIAQQP